MASQQTHLFMSDNPQPRFTELLEREELQGRLNLLGEMLETLLKEEREQFDEDRTAQIRWEILLMHEWEIPHSLPPGGFIKLEDGTMQHTSVPKYFQLTPEGQAEYDEACSKWHQERLDQQGKEMPSQHDDQLS